MPVTQIRWSLLAKKDKFKQICYSLFDFNLLDYVGAEAGRNFYECIVKVKDKRIHILLNSQYPFMAYTSTRDINVNDFPFIDEPELSKLFKQYYKILSPNQLNEPLRYTQKGKIIMVKNENNLHQAELVELVHWKPETVGDVVFNYWD